MIEPVIAQRIVQFAASVHLTVPRDAIRTAAAERLAPHAFAMHLRSDETGYSVRRRWH